MHAMKALGGKRGTAPLSLTLGTGREWSKSHSG